MRIFLLLLVIIFAAIFQIGKTADITVPVNPLRGEWQLMTLDDSVVDSADFSRNAPALAFSSSTATGSGGCNQIFADISIEENIVAFNRIKTTRLSCPDQEFEQQLLKILGNSAFTFVVKNDILILMNQEHILELKFIQ